MNKYQRLEACLAGAKPDRTPVSLWRHFPVDDQTPEGLAAATLDFQRTYDFDLVKVTPASSFCLRDWGARDEWRGATEGTRDYTDRVIQRPEDWSQLAVLDPRRGSLGEQLRCLEMVAKELKGAGPGQGTPFLQTVFSPLSQAKNLVGPEQLIVHLRKYPQALHAGLQIITESTLRFLEAACSRGIAGVFYAIQHASYQLLTQAEFETFGRAYDLQVLQAAQGLWLNMLHLHGNQVMFELAAGYPVQIVNWHDRDTWPSLGEARRLFAGVMCGGLQRHTTMVLGTPETVGQEARQAIEATQGERLILGTGCVLPTIAPRANLLAARAAVET